MKISIQAERAVRHLLGMAVVIAGASLSPVPAFGQKLDKLDVTGTITVTVFFSDEFGEPLFKVISGSGVLQKEGAGTLDLIDATNTFRGIINLKEGGLIIHEDKELGSRNSTLRFSGGTLSFSPVAKEIILHKKRWITLKNFGTFYIWNAGRTVHVESRLSGSSELKKIGFGDLNFEKVNARKFAGAIRLEAGGLVINEDDDLGRPTGDLIFSGGTLRFAAPPSPTVSIVVLESSRLITIVTGNTGAFDTMGTTVVVSSTLVGAGGLRKTGFGQLDFRNATISLFMGTIHLDAGGLLIDGDEDLGDGANGLIFSGGTVRFASPGPSISIVLKDSRLIAIGAGNTGTFDTMGNTVAVSSTISSAGELRKIGHGGLLLRNVDASEFAGTLRINEGYLDFHKSENLGSAELILSGGGLALAEHMTLTLNRKVIVDEGSYLYGRMSEIQSTISVVSGATLTMRGDITLGGRGHHIKNMHLEGSLAGSAESLGGAEPKTITFSDSSNLIFNQNGKKEGLIKEWDFAYLPTSSTVFATVIKRGAGTLTLDKHKSPKLLRYIIEEGTLVDKDRRGVGRRTFMLADVADGATLVMDYDIGSPTFLTYVVFGHGSLIKKGTGVMNSGNLIFADFSNSRRLEIQEGILWNPYWPVDTIALTGGTLAIGGPGIHGRLIKYDSETPRFIIENTGTFDIKQGYAIVMKNKRLSGTGQIRKTGDGGLDLRRIKTNRFTGTIRMEAGWLVVDENKDFGGASDLIFSGGGLSFDHDNSIFSSSHRITIYGRRIAVETTGMLYANRTGVIANSTLSGTGELRKLSHFPLILRNVDASKFTGALRIDASYLDVDRSEDLGSAELILSGGGLALAERMTLELDRKIIVDEGSYLYGQMSEIQSTISVANDATLTVNGYIILGDQENHIKNINLHGSLAGSAKSLGGAEPGTVTFSGASNLIFNQKENEDGLVKEWSFNLRAGESANLIKRGAGALTIDKNEFLGGGNFQFAIEAGQLVIDEYDDLGNASNLIFAGGTLRLGSTVAITVTTSRTMSVSGPNRAAIALDNTVVFKQPITVSDAATVQMGFHGSNARVIFDFAGNATVGNLVLHGGMNSVFEKQMDNSVLFLDEGIYRDDSRSATIIIRNRGRLAMRHKDSRLSVGWGVDIAAVTAQLRLSLAHVVQTVSGRTMTLEHIGPRSLSGAGSLVKVGEGYLDMSGTDTKGFTGGFSIQGGTVNIGASDSLLSISGWGVNISATTHLRLSLAHVVQTVDGNAMFKHHAGLKSLRGDGPLTKLGEGHLDMSGTDGGEFAGHLSIEEGTVEVGSLGENSKISVKDKGTLQGGRKIGSVTVFSGGTLYQGSSRTTLQVLGSYVQQVGGIYRLKLLDSQFIPISVRGTVSVAGNLEITVNSGMTVSSGSYPLFLADGGIIGTLSKSGSLFADSYITSFSNIGMLLFVPKPITVSAYHAHAQGRNGSGVAWALAQIEGRQGKFANYALQHITAADQARRALSSLSGQMHVSAQSAMMSAGTLLEDATVGQMRMAFDRQVLPSQQAFRTTMPAAMLGLADSSNSGGGLGIWAKSLEFEKRYGGSVDVSPFSYSSTGSLLGFDLPAGKWRAGLFSGTSQAQFSQVSGQSTGSSDSYHAGAYGTRMWDSLGFRAGLSYSSHAVQMNRKLALPGAGNQLSSSYGAHTFAVYGQLERQIGLGSALIEPFVGFSHVRHATEAFVEHGAAGLAISSDAQQSIASIVSAGLEGLTGFRLGPARMQARGMLAWRHELGGDNETVSRQSLGISDSFDVYGVDRAPDSLELDAGLDVRLSDDASLGLTYSESDLLDADGHDGHFRAVLSVATQ